MKINHKSLLTLVLISIIMLLPSCGNDEKRDPLFENYLIFSGDFEGTTTMLKMNVYTGNITALCSDPLCDHKPDSECKFCFAAQHSITEYNNRIYFERQKSILDHRRLICEYNPADDSISVIYETGEVGTIENVFYGSESLSIRAGYLWIKRQNADGTNEVSRMDLKTKETISLPSDTQLPYRETYRGECIYSIFTPGLPYGEYLSRGFALGDADGNIREKYATNRVIQIIYSGMTEDDVILFACPHLNENGEYDLDEQTLYSIDMKTGDEYVVRDKFGDRYFVRDANYIYYTDYVDNPPEIGFNKNSNHMNYNTCAGIILRTDIRTGETEEFMSLPEYNFAYNVYYIGGKIIFDYINTDYSTYTEEKTKYGTFYSYPKKQGYVIINPADKTYIDVVVSVSE